ncbi:MAG: sirohydrochlorin cobaltochelatase [Desulfobacteraceae bacterium]|nr:sirohydrochlorin cobaltochelatase [Desulfobacteraceae bacterium]
MTPSIVMAAFGTRWTADGPYAEIDRQVCQTFDGHAVRWAFSSRVVGRIASRRGISIPPGPGEVLADLHAAGHRWVVLQSTHVLCGHEFHRLLHCAAAAPLRVSVGLPLLTDPSDFEAVTALLADMANAEPDAATVFVGHGTDHPTWMAYPLLRSMLRRRGAATSFIGVLEGRPGIDDVVATLKAAGASRVRLVPLLIAAGNHFLRDLTGDDPRCWQRRLEAAGFKVEPVAEGIGRRPEIGALFCRHVAEALDVIPSSA